jgi:nitrite reductase/ring-hydroxylating ferredoxin subunit
MQICRLTDLPDLGARSFRVGEGDWPLRAFLVRQGDEVRAYVNRCPHAGHPLDLVPGRFLVADGSAIQCSSHGARFDLESGRCFSGPCQGRALQGVPVVVRDGQISLAETFRLTDYDP